MPAINAAVEVKRIELEGAMIRERWRLATVVYADTNKIGVKFRDGSLAMLPVSERNRTWK